LHNGLSYTKCCKLNLNPIYLPLEKIQLSNAHYQKSISVPADQSLNNDNR